MTTNAPSTSSEMERDPSECRTFAILLQTLEDGVLHAELTRAVPDLIGNLANVQAEAGGEPRGSLTLTLNFRLSADGYAETTGAFTVKDPKVKPRRTLLYVTPNNNLSARNPRQPDLPFGAVRRVGDEASPAARRA